MVERSDLRIVIVDDSDFSRSLMTGMLLEEGYKVAGEAPSAEAALHLMREKNPHVVITDIVMPEISGIELTQKINQDFEDVAVIVVSSLSQEHVVLEAIGAGARDFIPKPIQKQQLIDSLDKLRNEL